MISYYLYFLFGGKYPLFEMFSGAKTGTCLVAPSAPITDDTGAMPSSENSLVPPKASY